MTRLQIAFVLAFVTVLVLAWRSADSVSQERATTLPGARPAVDAANYPSLQAAIDALPTTGGVIRLPAGTFEINQPLRITQEDVLLEGAGTATHIKNVNQSGEPAILIESPKLAENPRATLWRVQFENLRVTGNEKSGHGIHGTPDRRDFPSRRDGQLSRRRWRAAG